MNPNVEQIDRLLTVAEARVRIPVGVTTMQNYIKSGTLRSLKVGGRRFVPESAIQDFIRAASAATDLIQETA